MTKTKHENVKVASLCHCESLSYLTCLRILYQTSERQERETWGMPETQLRVTFQRWPAVICQSIHQCQRHDALFKASEKKRLTNHVNMLQHHHQFRKKWINLENHSPVTMIVFSISTKISIWLFFLFSFLKHILIEILHNGVMCFVASVLHFIYRFYYVITHFGFYFFKLDYSPTL